MASSAPSASPVTAAGLVRRYFYPVTLGGSLLVAWGMTTAGMAQTATLAVVSLGLGSLCFVLERRFAETDHWALDRGEALADILHGLLSNPIPTALLRAALQSSLVALSGWMSARLGLGLWPVDAPLLLQFVLALLVADSVAYLVHRLLHATSLWRLHAVHHCSPRMYFLLSLRKHPLQSFVTYGARFGVLWFLGVPEGALTLLLAFTGANSYVQHANIDMDTSAWGGLFATPELHRVHHSSRESELGSNFGDVLILWDRMAGTRREPGGEPLHRHIGLPGIEVAQTWFAHLMLPFRWSRLYGDEERRTEHA